MKWLCQHGRPRVAVVLLPRNAPSGTCLARSFCRPSTDRYALNEDERKPILVTIMYGEFAKLMERLSEQEAIEEVGNFGCCFRLRLELDVPAAADRLSAVVLWTCCSSQCSCNAENLVPADDAPATGRHRRPLRCRFVIGFPLGFAPPVLHASSVHEDTAEDVRQRHPRPGLCESDGLALEPVRYCSVQNSSGRGSSHVDCVITQLQTPGVLNVCVVGRAYRGLFLDAMPTLLLRSCLLAASADMSAGPTRSSARGRPARRTTRWRCQRTM
jgi:hypothetical protein